jgi:cytochrome c-type biogenesis protein
MSYLSFPFAVFLAGFLSFLSPCVLPLVPGYVSMISGVGVDELRQQNTRLTRTVLLHALLFVLAFSGVFIALGAVASGIGQLAGQHLTLLNRVAGVIIILFGLHLTGLLPIRMLYFDRRMHGLSGRSKPTHALLVGFAFGFGWSPCVGPILAGILALAASEATVWHGVGLLALYSAGLAVPFLLTALGIDRFLSAYGKFRPHLRKVEVTGGALMIVIGVLVFSRHLTLLNSWLSDIPALRDLAERFL